MSCIKELRLSTVITNFYFFTRDILRCNWLGFFCQHRWLAGWTWTKAHPVEKNASAWKIHSLARSCGQGGQADSLRTAGQEKAPLWGFQEREKEGRTGRLNKTSTKWETPYFSRAGEDNTWPWKNHVWKSLSSGHSQEINSFLLSFLCRGDE